jgi:predicted AlkP superfamily pyrophosphatase or phosphodiesterase
MKMSLFLFSLFILFNGCGVHESRNNINKKSQKYVVVLSLDGFRWDYTEMYHTPVLDSIAQNGSKAQALIPSFPTKTFPNHYTIATGLYPDHHGIVNNSFYNPIIDREYKISDRTAVEDSRFYQGEPFWVTARKNGIKTASYFWVGSETKIKGKQPDIWKKFDSSIAFEQRIDSVLNWLHLPAKERPHFITFYFEQPDKVGHGNGPESPLTRKVVEQIDSLVGRFCTKKNELEIADSIDFIIVSDHGMASVNKTKALALRNYISDDLIKRCYGNNPFFLLEPKEGFNDSVFETLSNLEGIHVWNKNEVPDSLNYGGNEIIPSLVICAKPGWSVYADSSQFVNGGAHGYSPYFTDMHGVFYGIGPSFKRDFTHKAFRNVEIYNLVCKLLDIKPAANDGDFSTISELLEK